MKKVIFISLGIILFVNHARAFDTGILSQIKGDARKVCNGRYWNSLNSASKSTYVVAFTEGEFSYSIKLTSIHDNKVSKEERARLDQVITNQFYTNMNVGEIMDYLDKFYSDPLNINIPIHFAITIRCLQQHGGKVDEMIQLLRANSEPTND